MRRIFLAFAWAVFFTLLTPQTGEAAIIQCDTPSAVCQPIGFFTWDLGNILGDDIFTIRNLSDLIESPAIGAFTDVVVTVDPGLLSEAVAPFGTIAAGGQLDFPTVDPITLFFSSSQADLAFLFQSTRFELSLLGPGPSNSLIYAEAVVPEPASLLLVASGALALSILRRRRRQ